MLKALVTSALIVLPATVFAAEGGGSGSEFFFQSAAGAHELTPRLIYTSQSQQLDSATDATDRNTFVLAAEYEYGVMEGLAVGAQLSFVTGEQETGAQTTDISGLQNIEIFVKGSTPAGPGLFKYGAALSLSPGDQEVDGTGNDLEVNGYTGGHELTPYVGFEHAVATGIWGLKLATDIELSDRTQAVGSTDTDYSGKTDTTISAFYEHKLAATSVGVALDWTTTTDEKDETNSATADTEFISPTQVLRVYVPTAVGTGLLLPEVRYGFTTDDKVGSDDVDDYSLFAIHVGYRIAL